jgi:hypothetical protein
MIRSRAAGNLAYWVLPPLFCLVIHWAALQAWFRADDFAWLGLDRSVSNFHDVLRALFSPQAQGTIRPWSDRGLFIAGYALFGLNALPYRILIFATAFADLALVASLGTRLTGHRTAGFWAALFWTAGTYTAQPLTWVCVYNEVQCAFFLLLAFHFLLRYVETGAPRYYMYQWLVFLLGFGSLETNLVYPALAASYAFFCARRYLWKALAMAPVSVAYVLVHAAVAPVATTGVYGVHLDASMFKTLAVYWTWTVGPAYLSVPYRLSAWIILAAIGAVSMGLVAFVVRQARAGKLVALFFLSWFPLLLAPELPLRDHLTEYYPFLPAIGLAWLGGWAVAESRRFAAPLALVYICLVVPATMDSCRWGRNLTLKARDLVGGLARAHQLHPGQVILLHHLSGDQFWNAIYPKAFTFAGVDNVYVTPETGRVLAADAAWGDPTPFVLSGAVMARALEQDKAVVYDARGKRLRNITSAYPYPQEQDLPPEIQVGDPLVQFLLGPEWYSLETDHRWMPKRATLRLRGPIRAGQHLHLHGNCPEASLQAGPVSVMVTIDGVALSPVRISQTTFDAAFPIPDWLVRKQEIEVAIEVSRTFHPPDDPRELGLAFGEIAVE